MVTNMNPTDESQLELLLLPIGFLFISIGGGELLRSAGVVASNALYFCCWIFPAILIACCLVLLSGPKISRPGADVASVVPRLVDVTRHRHSVPVLEQFMAAVGLGLGNDAAVGVS